MKKLLYLLPFALLFASCYEAKRNCADFKTGKFNFEIEVNGVKQTTVVERTDSLQTETFNGKTTAARVRWVNDCEFIINNLHPKNREEKKAIGMRILTTKENTATIEYSLVGESNKQKGTITKIE
jgi:hypothetical protein